MVRISCRFQLGIPAYLRSALEQMSPLMTPRRACAVDLPLRLHKHVITPVGEQWKPSGTVTDHGCISLGHEESFMIFRMLAITALLASMCRSASAKQSSGDWSAPGLASAEDEQPRCMYMHKELQCQARGYARPAAMPGPLGCVLLQAAYVTFRVWCPDPAKVCDTTHTNRAHASH
jgi:hypothetical protein